MLTKIKNIASLVWSYWIGIVEWMTRNAKFVIAILVALNAFGMIDPDTATALRDAVFGLML